MYDTWSIPKSGRRVAVAKQLRTKYANYKCIIPVENICVLITFNILQNTLFLCYEKLFWKYVFL